MLVAALTLGACGETKKVGEAGFVQGFIGGVAADEPRAAVVGREVLSRGGTAADAATAMFFTLAVTKPSAAGLGAVGGCVYFDAPKRAFSAFDFTPAPKAVPAGAPPAIAPPAAVRGMAAIHARYGRLPWAELVGPAEALARFGHAVSRSLATDLAEAGPGLLRDPGMRGAFARPNGDLVQEGDTIRQLELAAALSQIRQRGAGALYAGPLAAAYLRGVAAIGGRLSAAELREYRPRALEPILRPVGDHRIAFLPTLNSNGPQQARLWRLLGENRALERADRDTRLHLVAEASVLAHADFARLVREPGADLDAFDDAAAERLDSRFQAFNPDQVQPIETWFQDASPAPTEISGTSIVVVDRGGSAAACGFTLYRKFGAGRLLAEVGAAPALSPPPGVISSAVGPMIVGNLITGDFLLAVGGSGAGASTAQVVIAARTLRGGEQINPAVGSPRFSRGGGPGEMFVEADVGAESRAALEAKGYRLSESEPIAKINAAYCEGGIQRSQKACDVRTDWRGHGLASSAR